MKLEKQKAIKEMITMSIVNGMRKFRIDYKGGHVLSIGRGNKYKRLACEYIKSDVGRIHIRFNDKRIAVHKHYVIWIMRNGYIPEDKMISFVDGNKKNCSIDNLVMVERNDFLPYEGSFMPTKDINWRIRERVKQLYLSGLSKRKICKFFSMSDHQLNNILCKIKESKTSGTTSADTTSK